MPISEPDTVTTFVGLGSNLGDREDNLQTAVDRLSAHPKIHVGDVSAVYETEAHTLGEESQSAYLNAVVRLATTLRAKELLAVCHAIERKMGRDRAGEKRWAARTIDLDILTYGSETVNESDIVIPHPRMGRRRFALEPLTDLAPDLWIPPPYDATPRELLEACRDETAVDKTALTIIP